MDWFRTQTFPKNFNYLHACMAKPSMKELDYERVVQNHKGDIYQILGQGEGAAFKSLSTRFFAIASPDLLRTPKIYLLVFASKELFKLRALVCNASLFLTHFNKNY